jgi:hypothetical protein
MDAIVPGPCPPTGCPPPTEIDCVIVDKVYDSCIQLHDLGIVATDLQPDCFTGAQAGGSCQVTGIACAEAARTQEGDFATIILSVAVFRTITITNAAGGVICTFTTTDNFFKTVTLCSPPGTTVNCQLVSATCGPCFLSLGGSVINCPVQICMLITSTASVALLIPTYGFCSPAPCSTAPLLPCPPGALFPPQCT